MQPSTDVAAFLVELYKRMSLKSPRFFQILQAIGMAAALITGIPLFIQQVEMFTGLHIALPDVVNHWVTRVIFWCGVMVKIMAKLPVHQPPTDHGEPVTKKEALPFTSVADKKK
jgi:hypothetical protein